MGRKSKGRLASAEHPVIYLRSIKKTGKNFNLFLKTIIWTGRLYEPDDPIQ